MPAPEFTLPTTGTSPKIATRLGLEAGINAVSQALFDQIGAISTGLKPAGNWDASGGAFPSGAERGTYYVVNAAGTVDGAAFAIGDWLIPLVDGPETGTYAGNWFRGDYSKVVPDKPDSAAAFEAGSDVSRGPGALWETKDGFRYEEVTAGEDLTNAAGVKLKVSRQNGKWPGRAFKLVGDGATDDTAAFKKAVAAAGQGGTLDIGQGFNYLLTEGIYAECHIVGKSDISFNIPNNTDDCLVMRPAQNQPIRLDVENINCQETGRDGVRFERGNPEGNFVVNDPYRDGIAHYCDGTRFDWIENTMFGKVRVGRAGRHAWHITIAITGDNNDTPFINETTVDSFEVRGVGRRFTDASPIRVTYDGTTQINTDKVSGLNINQLNVDVQYGHALGTISDMLSARSVNGGVGALEAININAGGVESTGAGGQVPGSPKFIEADPAISLRDVRFIGGITYNYCVDFGQAVKDDPASFVMVTNGGIGKGAYFPRAKTKSGNVAFEGEADGALSGFANAPVAQTFELSMTASVTVTHDIPVTVLTGFQVQEPIVVLLNHQGYRTNSNDRARGLWVVTLAEEGGTNYAHAWAIATDGANPQYSFTPSTDVTFSMLNAETLRLTIACGASVGTGGRSRKVRGNVSRGLAGTLQGALANLSIPLMI